MIAAYAKAQNMGTSNYSKLNQNVHKASVPKFCKSTVLYKHYQELQCKDLLHLDRTLVVGETSYR